MTDPALPADGQTPVIEESHSWSELDPLVKFGVGLGAILFCGVVFLGMFLVPYALISNGWTPGTK